MTDRWDPAIPLHKTVAHGIEVGDGIPEMRTIADCRDAVKAVGFEIEHEEDLAERADAVPWYYPLEGDIFKAQTAWDYVTVWRMTWSGKLFTHHALRVLEAVGLVPKGTWEVGETLKTAADALVKGGQLKVRLRSQRVGVLLIRIRSYSRRCTWSLPASRRVRDTIRLACIQDSNT